MIVDEGEKLERSQTERGRCAVVLRTASVRSIARRSPVAPTQVIGLANKEGHGAAALAGRVGVESSFPVVDTKIGTTSAPSAAHSRVSR